MPCRRKGGKKTNHSEYSNSVRVEKYQKLVKRDPIRKMKERHLTQYYTGEKKYVIPVNTLGIVTSETPDTTSIKSKTFFFFKYKFKIVKTSYKSRFEICITGKSFPTVGSTEFFKKKIHLSGRRKDGVVKRRGEGRGGGDV